jgi:hypothetical protein
MGWRDVPPVRAAGICWNSPSGEDQEQRPKWPVRDIDD